MNRKFRAPRLYKISPCTNSALTARVTPSSDTLLKIRGVSCMDYCKSEEDVRNVVSTSPEDLEIGHFRKYQSEQRSSDALSSEFSAVHVALPGSHS